MLKVNQLMGFWTSALAIALVTNVGGAALTANETDALGIDFTYDTLRAKQMSVLDTTTPANAGDFDPFTKLTYTSPSVKLCRQADGVWRYSNHNYSTRSQEFNDVSAFGFNVAGASASGNTDTAPDSSFTADRIIEDSTNGRHFLYQAIGVGLVSAVVGANYQASVYLKQGTRRYAAVGMFGSSFRYTTVVDLQTGTVTDTFSSGTPTGTANAVTIEANGFYRIKVNMDADTTVIYHSICLSNSATPAYSFGEPSYVGDGSSYIIAWGSAMKRYPVSEAGPTTNGVTGYIATTNAVKYDLPYEWNAAGVAQGILVEEQRQNLVQKSQEFNDAAWLKSNITVAANSTTAPDGTSTADKFVSAASTDQKTCYYSSGFTGTAAAYTFSVFLKAAGFNFAQVCLSEASDHGFTVNLSTGTIGTGTVGTYTTASIADAGNGWYRVSITKTLTPASWYPLICLADGDTAPRDTVVGDGSSGIYVWGAQVELGSFATSPIHTIGATVTRAPDNIGVPTSLFPLSATVGTLVAETNINIIPFSTQQWLNLTGTDNAYLSMVNGATGDPKFGVYLTGSFTTQCDIDLGTGTNGTRSMAGTWSASNDFAGCYNGGTVLTDNSGSPPATAMTSLKLGCNQTPAEFLNGYLRKVTYLKRRCTNGELQARTGGVDDWLTFGGSDLLNSEPAGLSIDFSYHTDRSKQYRNIIPAPSPSNVAGDPINLLTYTSPASFGKMCRQSDGIYRYSNHNFQRRSQELDNAAWNKNNTTASGNVTTAPDGTMTADSIVETTANDAHRIFDSGGSATVEVPNGAMAQVSVYAKALGTGSTRWLSLWAGDGGPAVNAIFDLSGAGSVTNTFAGSSTIVSTSITSMGNGWYRCVIVFVSATAAGLVYVQPALSNSATPTRNGEGHASYTGDGVSGLYMWGVEGKRYPVNETGPITNGIVGYVPTTTSKRYDLPYEWNAAGVSQGILIEEQRINLALRSQEFDVLWAQIGCTVTANQTTAPDGTTTADKATGTTGMSLNAATMTVVSGSNYTVSIFAKYIDNPWIRIQFSDNVVNDRVRVWFNIQTGVVGSNAVTGSGAYVSSSIVDAGNGWYRCILTGSIANTTANFILNNVTGDGSNTASNPGSVYYWGAQFELGAFATSPIHTLGATVTRAGDTISLAHSAYAVSTTAATAVMSFDIQLNGGISLLFIGTQANGSQYIVKAGSFQYKFGIWGGGGSEVIAPGTGDLSDKFGAAYTSGDTAVVLNGGSVGTGTAVWTLANNTTTRFFGDFVSNAHGYLKQFTYIPRRVTNAELQSRTT